MVIAVVAGFLINKVPAWKQKIIEVINPAAKSARILGELDASLDELGRDVANEKSKELVQKSRGLVSELISSNDKNSGIIKQQVGKIIDALLDRTPYPADHLKLPVNENGVPLICPPNN